MVDKNRTPQFSAEVIDDATTVYFYIVRAIGYNENQSIKTFVAPYTTAGRTQNLGRFPITLNYDFLIVKYYMNNRVISIEETLNELTNIKRLRKKLRLNVPQLPIGSSRFYMGDMSVKLKEPLRLILTVSFTEILEDSLKRSVQNLVLNNSMENVKALLQQRGQV